MSLVPVQKKCWRHIVLPLFLFGFGEHMYCDKLQYLWNELCFSNIGLPAFPTAISIGIFQEQYATEKL